MKKKLMSVLLAGTMVLSLAACGETGADTATSDSAPAETKEEAPAETAEAPAETAEAPAETTETAEAPDWFFHLSKGCK